MHRTLLILGLFCTCFWVRSQEEKPVERQADSVQQVMAEQGVVAKKVERAPANPLAPSKAAFYSALLPGLGQAYNKSYWKIPIVWGAIGTGIYVYLYNDREYNRYRTAFKRRQAGFTDDEFFDLNPDDDFVPTTPNVSDQSLQDAQERLASDRDLALLITIGLYALNIIDANVDAHLKQYNVNEDLTLNIQPYMETIAINREINYGLAVAIRF